jgi:hypothetical protein
MFLSTCGSSCSLSIGDNVTFEQNGITGTQGAGRALFVVNAEALQPPNDATVAAACQEQGNIDSCNGSTISSSGSSSRAVAVPSTVLAALSSQSNNSAEGDQVDDLASVPVMLGAAHIEPEVPIAEESSSSSSKGLGLCGLGGNGFAEFAWLADGPLAVESGAFFTLEV